MGFRPFLHRLTAPRPSIKAVNASVKLVCVVNQSLKMGKGKICLKIPDGSSFESLMKQAQEHEIPFHLVRDAGHTQIPKGSSTVLALGPYDESTLDGLTGHLKLL